MKLNYILLFIALFILVFSINGCTPQSSMQNECSAYDGTWKGVISTSGLIESTKTLDVLEEPARAPFIAQYDFEMTIKYDANAPYSEEDHICPYKITYVKAAHPLFECTAGCVPVQEVKANEKIYSSWMSTNKEGYGSMHIGFSNGATIPMFTEENRIRLTQGRIELYIPENVEDWETIGIRSNPDYKTIQDQFTFWVETDNCYKVGNIFCDVISLNKNTIILNRIN